MSKHHHSLTSSRRATERCTCTLRPSKPAFPSSLSRVTIRGSWRQSQRTWQHLPPTRPEALCSWMSILRLAAFAPLVEPDPILDCRESFLAMLPGLKRSFLPPLVATDHSM